jgi:hypothetical protein
MAVIRTRGPLRVATALLSVAAGAIHLAVIDAHFREYWLFGVFFVIVALFQVGWGVLILFRQRPAFLWLGGAVNAAVLGIWTLSRTVGLPLGPGAGIPESISLTDLVASGYEILIVAGVAGLLRPQWVSKVRLSPQAAKAAALVSLVAMLPVTALAVQSGFQHEHGYEVGHSREHDHGSAQPHDH